MSPSARRSLFAVLAAAFVFGCQSTYKRANELAEKGQFIEAAELFERLVREKPDDKEVRELRDRARWRALEHLLGQARLARRDGKPMEAEDQLEAFLSYRLRWNTKLNGALESSLSDELEETHKHLRAYIGDPARKGEALLAEQRYRRKQKLLQHEELKEMNQEMRSTVSSSGQRTCAELKAKAQPQQPYFTQLVVRYCEHFSSPAPAPPALPDASPTLAVDGSLGGTSAAQTEGLRARLVAAFEKSPWSSPKGTAKAPATLSGELEARIQRSPVVLNVPWTEQVPYVAFVTRTEPYQEHYIDQEPYTAYENGQPVTRTKNVERTRTKYREVTAKETRDRPEPRVYRHEAVEVSVRYALSVVVKASLGARGGLTATANPVFTYVGHDHNASFPPAGVAPSRAQFPACEAWYEGQLSAMERSFGELLQQRWREDFCSAGAYSLDEAARGARGVDELPTPARSELAKVLGDDAPLVPSLLP